MVTGCDIPVVQNSKPAIDLLCAISETYTRAKTIMALQFTLTVPAALASSVLMAWQQDWKIWLTSFSISVALLDVLRLQRAQIGLRKRGATLQQMFDAKVLKLPWRPLRCGSVVDSADVFSAAQKFVARAKSTDGMRDWYPVVIGKIPIHLARIICQHASLFWDLRQREHVRGGLTLIMVALALFVFIIALGRGDTVEEMILSVYVPLAPAVIWILREILAQGDAINADERGLIAADQLWKRASQQALTPDELERESLLIQDALFDNRSRSPAVFTWIYNLLRKQREDEMQYKAAEMVAELLATTLSRPPKATLSTN
ncbi:MAG TPA: S-4TM family putative pore-forming effector [Candidatus Acidoferrum sp.]|nr:S-4TM family putative pore-forming effector [Candidatus Acidoferrum sp.]